MSQFLIIQPWAGFLTGDPARFRVGQVISSEQYGGITLGGLRREGVSAIPYDDALAPVVEALHRRAPMGDEEDQSAIELLHSFGFLGTPGETAKFVDTVEDLPDPVAGVRTLLAGTTYYLRGSIVLPDGERVVCSDGSNIIGRVGSVDTLEGNVDAPLVSHDVPNPARTLRFVEVTLRNLNAGANARAFYFAGTGANFNGSFLNTVGEVEVGTAQSFVLSSSFIASLGADGDAIHVTGTVGTLALNDYASILSGTGSAMVRFGAAAVVSVFSSANSTAVFTSPTQFGFVLETPGSVSTGRLNLANFVGAGGTPTSGFDFTTPGWRIFDSPVIPDSSIGGGSSLTTSPITVTLPVTNQYEDISDGATSAHTLGSGSERFELVSALTGEIRYIGTRVHKFVVHGIMTALRSGGADFLLEQSIAVNGTPVTGSGTQRDVTTRAGTAACVPVIVALNPNDTVRLVARNLETTTPADVISAGIVAVPL